MSGLGSDLNRKWQLKNVLLTTLSGISACSFLDVNFYAWADRDLLTNAVSNISSSHVSRHNVSSYTKQMDVKQMDTDAESLYQMQQYSEAIKKWQEMLNLVVDLEEKATIYNNLGLAYRQMGQISEAIAQWQFAISIYESLNLNPKIHDRLAKLIIDQAQAYIAIGQQQQAIHLLKKVVAVVNEGTANNSNANVENMQLAKGALGNAYFALGDNERAITAYQESINLTSKTRLVASGWMNLGNAFTKSARGYQDQLQVEMEEGNALEVSRLRKLQEQSLDSAYKSYSRSLQLDADVLLKSQALLNLAHLVRDYDLKDAPKAQFSKYRQQASDLLAIAPPSRPKIYALIDLASLHQKSSPVLQIQFLEHALTIAQTIGDRRGESFVMGEIGRVYETQGSLTEALSYTSQAQWLAQANNAPDSLYRWQWQSGRILKAKGDRSKAIISYRQAIATLQSIRSDIIAADRSFQLDVRDSVEPVYRELMELLLEANSINQQSILEEVLQVSELLRLSELQNFFGDDCLANKEISPVNQGFFNQFQRNLALIYTLSLERHTYIVMRLPDNSLKSYLIPLTKAELSDRIKNIRFTLENVATNEYINSTKEIYNLLIHPIEKDLQRSSVELLVFVNDGVLRNIPMAALYDGKQFLIQKYPIIYLVGSKLAIEPNPVSANIDLVGFGLSEAIAPFAALPNVLEEFKVLEKIWKSKTSDRREWNLFLNRDFTFDNFQAQVKQGYGVVHLATHARFGATPATTFLQAFDRRINLDQLESTLRLSKTQIELLVLSACQTASGDNRSILGLAGIALRAGVTNVLATLWAVDDENVIPLIKNFYSAWQINGLTKAQALQKAQIQAITQNNLHPSIWSAFILVGN